MRIASTLAGALFGFLLVRSGATDFDAIAGMFTLRDLHLAGVMGVAIGLAAVGLRLHARLTGTPLPPAKPMHPGVIAGGLVFGAGWGLTGTCPGTAIAQLGEGKLYGACTLAGMLLGALAHSAWERAREARGGAAAVTAPSAGAAPPP